MKRGITPLISMVILVGFTIVLAALIFKWSSGFLTVEEQRSPACMTQIQQMCLHTSSEFVATTENPGKVTKNENNGSLTISLQNNGAYPIDAFIAHVQEGTPPQTLISNITIVGGLSPYIPITFVLDYEIENPDYQSMKLIPIISYELNGMCETACTRKEIEWTF